MTCVIQKQDVPTLLQSQNLVQNLLGTSIGTIAYLRHFLPEDNFADVVVGGVKVKAIRKGSSEKGNALLKWLDGCFEALQKKYLESVIFGLFQDPKEPQKFNEVNMTVLNQKNSKNCSTQQFSKKDIMKATSEMLRRLVVMTQNMEKVPDESYLTMKLYYNSQAPDDYEPPCFKALEDDDNEVMMEDVKIGEVDTNYHRVQFLIKTRKERDFDEIEGINGKGSEQLGEVIMNDSQIAQVDQQMKKMKLRNEKNSDDLMSTQRASFVESSQQARVPEITSTQEIIQKLYEDKNESTAFVPRDQGLPIDHNGPEGSEMVYKKFESKGHDANGSESMSVIYDNEKREKYDFKCICGSKKQCDLKLVSCSKCNFLGHAACLGFTDADSTPKDYLCYECKESLIDDSGLREIALIRKTLWLIWNEDVLDKEAISELLDIDDDALNLVVTRLRKHGIIQSYRGRKKGMKLIKNGGTKKIYDFYFSIRCEEEIEESEERGRTKEKQTVKKKRKVSIAREFIKI